LNKSLFYQIKAHFLGFQASNNKRKKLRFKMARNKIQKLTAILRHSVLSKNIKSYFLTKKTLHENRKS
jgi:hypothetical protein